MSSAGSCQSLALIECVEVIEEKPSLFCSGWNHLWHQFRELPSTPTDAIICLQIEESVFGTSLEVRRRDSVSTGVIVVELRRCFVHVHPARTWGPPPPPPFFFFSWRQDSGPCNGITLFWPTSDSGLGSKLGTADAQCASCSHPSLCRSLFLSDVCDCVLVLLFKSY